MMLFSSDQTASNLRRTLAVVLMLGSLIWISISGDATHSAIEPAPQREQVLSEFGVIGDGVVDDTAAIQRAIDAGIGNLRFPKGIYRITKTIIVEVDKTGFTSVHGDGVATIRMEGAGPALKIIGTHFSSAGPEKFEDRVWKRQRMPMIDGIGITASHAEADGIEAVGTMQLTITRTHVRGCRHGIRLAENNRNVIISDCHIYDNRGIGIFYDNVNLHQSNITGSHISYNGGGGIVSRRGNVRNVHITGCDLESNMSPDMPPTANVLIDCRGSTHGAAEIAVTGCTIQHNHRADDSANIRIFGHSDVSESPEPTREGNVTISGNVFSDVDVNVHLKDCRGVVLTGNTFWMGFRHNMLIENCCSVVIGTNNLDRNPRYNYGRSKEASNSVILRDCQDCTISGLHITNVRDQPAGVTATRCQRMNISNCTILDCDNAGLLLDQVSDSRVSGCLIRDDRAESTSVPLKIIGGKGNLIDQDVASSQN